MTAAKIKAYNSELCLNNKLARGIWDIAYVSFFRISPSLIHVWITARAYVGLGVIIGNNAKLGTSADITKNNDDNITAIGYPAKAMNKEEVLPRRT